MVQFEFLEMLVDRAASASRLPVAAAKRVIPVDAWQASILFIWAVCTVGAVSMGIAHWG
jgi:hypothetical protein